MRKRTESEIYAYVAGYTNSYNMFIKYLDMGIRRNREAAEKMHLMVLATQSVIVSKKEENEDEGTENPVH